MKQKEVVSMTGIMLLFVIGATIHATQGVMLSSYIEEYSLRGGAQGYSTSIQEIGLILSIFLSAYLLRKFAKPRILLFMAILMTFSLVGLGFKPAYWLLCTFYFCFGLSFGSLDSLASSLISDLYPEKSSAMMSYMRAFYSAGGMLAPLFLTQMLRKGLVWNEAILIAAGFCMMLLLYFSFVSYPKIPKQSDHYDVRDDVSFRALFSFIKMPGALLIILIGFFFASHQIGLTVWIVRYFTVYKPIGAIVSFILSSYWIGTLLSRVFLPRRRLSPKTILIGGTFVSGILLSVCLSINHGILACILMVLVGFSQGLVVPTVVDCACEIDRSNSALSCSTLIFVNNIGGMVAPPLMGLIIANTSAQVGISFLPLTLFICCGLSVILFKKYWRDHVEDSKSQPNL